MDRHAIPAEQDLEDLHRGLPMMHAAPSLAGFADREDSDFRAESSFGKMRGLRVYLRTVMFSDSIAGRLRGHPAPDRLLPMPLHPARLKERGFNQSLEIARVLRRRLGWPLVPDLAIRIRNTPPQVGLAAKDRKRNLRGAFECAGQLDGQRIAILDDVMTSGSSMGEVARVLKRGGAVEVIAVAVARTLPGRS